MHEAIRRLGYVYHRGAANLRRSASDIVGMVINDLTNPFFAEMAVGIEAALQTAGLVPFLANTGESPDRQARGDALDARARRRRLHRSARRIGTDARLLAEMQAGACRS